MIDDVSKTLRAILTQGELPEELSAAQIVFDHPSENFNPQQTTVDLFLYDIREDTQLRTNEEIIERRNGRVFTHRPPMRVACSYLVTAWPVGGPDLALQEQRLLGQVLQAFAQHPVIKRDLRHGSLKEQAPDPPLVTALVDPQKNLSEFWTALGSQLRPSLTITVTFSLEVAKVDDSAMVISAETLVEPRKSVTDPKKQVGERDRFFRIGGRVLDAQKKPIEKARVLMVGTGLEKSTDARGRFVLSGVEAGDFTLRVESGSKTQEFEIHVPPRDKENYDLALT
jgi:hypothetical protein